MNILGINFGHDASLSLLEGDTLVGFLELERDTRLKHNVGLRADDVTRFLAGFSRSLKDVDVVALTGTQWYKAKHSSDITIAPGGDGAMFSPFDAGKMVRTLPAGGTDGWYEYAAHEQRLGGAVQQAFPLDAITGGFIGCGGDTFSRLSEELAALAAGTPRADGRLRPYEALIPYAMTLGGITLPAFFVPHHVAHAAYGAFYRRPGSDCLVVSHDGGWPHIAFNAGGLFLLKDNQLCPLLDPNLYVGQLYQRMGELAGFGVAEAPGKLMGLAAYGIANGADLHPIRNRLIAAARHSDKPGVAVFDQELKEVMAALEIGSRQVALRPGYARFDYAFADVKRSIGIAAATQALVEEVWTTVTAPLVELVATSLAIDPTVPVVGGFSLNCPSNGRLQAGVTSVRLNPLPGGSDMGTALGGACYLSGVLRGTMPANTNGDYRAAAFPPRAASYRLGPIETRHGLVPVAVEDPVAFYAEQLLAGKIFCHAEGDSEVGPRALGHRSIIAHARHGATRDKINHHKGRENWRPLAPMVRDVDFATYFAGVDDGSASIFMLHTYRVIRDDVEAVTHVDRTARAQVIKDGLLYEVLGRITREGAVPMLVNTSFNVAGEPLVENVDHVVKSFKALRFDYLYLEGRFYQAPAS